MKKLVKNLANYKDQKVNN